MNRSQIVEDIIVELRDFAKLYAIDSLFVVGGYCRAKIMNEVDAINDIDIASAYPREAMKLCGLFSSEVLHEVPRFYHRTGTGVVETKNGLRIEFQSQSSNSYMQNETIRSWMRKKSIRNTSLLNNVYGRDFTINSIIMSLKNGELYDLTKRAVHDIQKKRIVTILPAELIVQFNPLIILRAIRFATRYDFIIDAMLRKTMKENINSLFKHYSRERITQEIEKILQSDVEKGLEQLKKFNLTRAIIPEQLDKYIKARKNEKNKSTNES